MTSGLDAFRTVNFDWTRQLKSVWRDPNYHVPGVHQQAVDDLVDYFLLKTVNPDPDDEPLGRVGQRLTGTIHAIAIGGDEPEMCREAVGQDQAG